MLIINDKPFRLKGFFFFNAEENSFVDVQFKSYRLWILLKPSVALSNKKDHFVGSMRKIN